MDNDDGFDGVGGEGGAWIGSKRVMMEIVDATGEGVSVLQVCTNLLKVRFSKWPMACDIYGFPQGIPNGTLKLASF